MYKLPKPPPPRLLTETDPPSAYLTVAKNNPCHGHRRHVKRPQPGATTRLGGGRAADVGGLGRGTGVRCATPPRNHEPRHDRLFLSSLARAAVRECLPITSLTPPRDFSAKYRIIFTTRHGPAVFIVIVPLPLPFVTGRSVGKAGSFGAAHDGFLYELPFFSPDCKMKKFVLEINEPEALLHELFRKF